MNYKLNTVSLFVNVSLDRNPASLAEQDTQSGAMRVAAPFDSSPDLVLAGATLYVLDD
jgi:hypothetical protein